jgi:divalent metal cation (Fe/Co/Zn/Cd) transporter
MIVEAGPNLLDHALPIQTKARLHHALAAVVPSSELVRVRTRQSGSLAQVELVLAAPPGLSCSDVKMRITTWRLALREHIPGADIAVAVAPTADLGRDERWPR